MIRGTIQRKKSVPSPIDLGALFKEHADLLGNIENIRQDLHDKYNEGLKRHKEMTALHETASAAHDGFLSQVAQKIDYLDLLIQKVKTTTHKGDPGKDADPVDEKALEERIFSRIQVPTVDENAIVDRIVASLPPQEAVNYDKVAKKAAALLPKPKDGKDADHAKIVETVIEALTTGKKKIKVEHIEGFKEGLEQTIAPIRSLAAGFRGGGDTVEAGSNITITNINGKKRISGTSGGISKLTATGTVDNSNKTFTFASTPQIVVVNGASYIDGFGVSISGTTATLDNPVGTGGSIFGLG